MSLKAELETWAAALNAYDEQDFPKSLELFERIADTSRILCNIGLIYATLGEHELAVDNFNAATSLDRHLAVGYFQCGVSNFLLGRYELAYKDFDEALVHLRSNPFIDYEQLGLKFKLWSAEVIFNKGLCQIYLGNVNMGLQDLEVARKMKATEEHNVIDDAIADKGENYTVFSIPVGVLYRPAESKIKNVKTKDYLGKAKLVAASETKDAFTEFVGVKRLEQGLGPSGQPLDRPSQSGTDADSAITLVQRSRPPSPNQGNAPSRSLPMPPQKLPDGLHPSASDAALARSKTSADSRSNRLRDDVLGMQRPRAGSAEDVLQRSNTQIRPLPSGVPTRAATMRSRGNTIDNGGGRVSPARADGRRPSFDDRGDYQRRPSIANDRSPLRNERATERPNLPIPRDLDQERTIRPSRNNDPISRGASPPNPSDGRRDEGPGVSQIYDSYLYPTGRRSQDEQAYDGIVEAVDPSRRVAAWQSRTLPGASPNLPPSRVPSQRGVPSLSNSMTPTGGSVMGAGVKRAPSRKQSYGMGLARSKSTRNGGSRYGDEDDADSYGSDIPFENMKIRIKIHYDDDTRGMAITPSTSFDEFVEMLVTKFSKRWETLRLKFRDEDGGKISLKDAMDWDMAIEVARESVNPQGKPEARLEIWMTDA
ncbi:hypothetical protein FRB99_000677 [Tulasnella sp. 403]|nr:hypothetical protein FRB99_000677 [Tulasnella sp. 403]